jgi:hypothetical protein
VRREVIGNATLYLGDCLNAELPLDDDAERAAVIVRHVCRVKSRAELDHSDAAATIFHERIRKPWHQHSQQ